MGSNPPKQHLLTLTSAQQADIAVDKDVNNDTPQVGEDVTFSIEVTNNGPSTAQNVQVIDQLPPDFLLSLHHYPVIMMKIQVSGMSDLCQMVHHRL